MEQWKLFEDLDKLQDMNEEPITWEQIDPVTVEQLRSDRQISLAEYEAEQEELYRIECRIRSMENHITKMDPIGAGPEYEAYFEKLLEERRAGNAQRLALNKAKAELNGKGKLLEATERIHKNAAQWAVAPNEARQRKLWEEIELDLGMIWELIR